LAEVSKSRRRLRRSCFPEFGGNAVASDCSTCYYRLRVGQELFDHQNKNDVKEDLSATENGCVSSTSFVQGLRNKLISEILVDVPSTATDHVDRH
jgi:hypothetical protein